MKFNVKRYLLVFVGFYFLIEPLRQFLVFGKPLKFLIDFNLESFLLTFSTISCFFLISLFVYTAFFKYLEKKKWLSLAGLSLLGFFIPVGFRYLVEQHVYDYLFGFTNYRRDIDVFSYYNDNIYYFLLYGTLAAVYFYIMYTKYRENREYKLVEENQKMQLDLLRSQINPHFLMNAMNNIYSLVFLKSDKSLEAIDKLSEILKYTLYENKENVKIKEEIKYLNNYIELQKIRYEHEPHVEIVIDERILDCLVPQFLMVPLVENAFKHGDVHNAKNPIKLSINAKDGDIEISMFNMKKQKEKDGQGGIGLDNVKKRLVLIYGDKHELLIDDLEHSFLIRIKIPQAR